MNNKTRCTCTLNQSRAESLAMVAALPDDLTYDLSNPLNQPIIYDRDQASSNFVGNKFFTYTCSPISNINDKGGCFTATRNFFNRNYLQITVRPSASILNFDIQLRNNITGSTSVACSQSIRSSVFLLYEGDGGRLD